jgi:hypothetical protein
MGGAYSTYGKMTDTSKILVGKLEGNSIESDWETELLRKFMNVRVSEK